MLKYILLLLIAWLSCVLCGQHSPIVKTTTGSVRGKVNRVLNGQVNLFLGIPYAKPPLGNLRFRNPEPIKPWDGIYDATKPPVSCMQHRAVPLPWIAFPPYSEDCLYLNVWVPQERKAKHSKPKAVFIMIHGGGAYSGSSSIEMYDGSVLSLFGDVIVASMNYRVGVFGFLNADIKGAPGNMGMMDQLMALQWIKDNAVAFGGDPDRITLCGQSVGGVSTGLHVLSPLSRGLFHRGIMMAGNMYQHQFKGDSRPRAVAKGDKFARAVGCGNQNMSLVSHPQQVVECLRQKDAKELAKAESYFWVTYLFWFLPTYNTRFMPLNPIIAVRERRFNIKEILTGFNSDEGSLFAVLMATDVLGYESALRLSIKEARAVLPVLYKREWTSFPTPDEVAQEYLENKYLQSGTKDVLLTLYQSYSDYLFLCPTVLFSERFVGYNSSLYQYMFDYMPSNTPWRPWMAAVHFEENQFQFGIPLLNPTLYTEEEVNLSRMIMGAWTSFAKTGKPLLPDGMKWPKFDEKYRRHLHIKGSRLVVRSLSVDEHCKFWDRNLV